VVAVTGIIITFNPGVIRMDRDLPEQNLKAGDKILTYAYRGEGESAVWFHGQVKLSSGRVGWVNMDDAEFDFSGN
jgi:hypothetical protein